MSIIKTVRKRRRSLVRFLASCVPTFLWEYLFPVPPRMYISWSLIEKISDLKQNNFPSDDSNTSFCSFKQNFHSRNQQPIFNSTPKKGVDVYADKLKALQEELCEIKKMVAKLMERQTEQCSGYGTLSNPSDQLQKSFIPPPAPPTPPPLPPPDFSLVPVNSLKIEKKNSCLPHNGFPNGKDLLRDIKKVQLKKVEKSPGGSPLKKPSKAVNDPGNLLAAILKKRFGCIQNSPDSSLDSIDADKSFGSGAFDNDFETGKNKVTVL